MEIGKWSLTTLQKYLEKGRQSQKCIYLTQFGQFSLGEEVWYPECIDLVRIWLANPQTNLIIDCWRNEHTTVVIDAFNCHHLKVHMHMNVLHIALDSLTHTHTHTYLSRKERTGDVVGNLHLDTAPFAPQGLHWSLKKTGASVEVPFSLAQHLTCVHCWLLWTHNHILLLELYKDGYRVHVHVDCIVEEI